MENKPWTEKYRPKKFSDIKGQDFAVRRLLLFLKNFKNKKKSAILYGPPGVGKTTLAYVVARASNAEIFELNASDLRNKEKLDEVLKPAIEQKSLTKKGKVILVDEVDGISGYYDKGGIPELLKLINLSKYPIIITANDVWKKNLAPIRRKSELIELKEVNYKTILLILEQISKKEGLKINYSILKGISVRAKGDIRAAINDLQSVAKTGSTKESISEVTLHERDKEVDIFSVLRNIFKGKPSENTLKIFDSLKMNFDEIFLWLEKNIPYEYSGEALARAFDLLSKADLFRGRIYKQQYWRFMVYENIFLSYGISASKNLKDFSNTNFVRYHKPTRILKMWLHNQKIEKKKSIALKYAKYTHIGGKRALNEFPIVKLIIKSDPLIQKELKLSDDEIEYIMK